MHTGHEITRSAVSRRMFLAASGLTFCGLNLPAFAAPAGRRHAKSTILVWLSGGASHIDTWDAGAHHGVYSTNPRAGPPTPTFGQFLNDRNPLPPDCPFVGSVVAAKRPPPPSLPALITLPQKTGAPRYTRPGQFSAKLGSE